MNLTHEPPQTTWKRADNIKGIFVTDFDGTLLRSDRTFADADLKALEDLEKFRIARVIATGRSMFSFNKSADLNLPIDYIIFSTGAGVVQYPRGTIVKTAQLESSEVRQAANILLENELDFMIHRPIPENHEFVYYATGNQNSDFENRISLYRPYAAPLDSLDDGFGPACQLLAVLPPRWDSSAVERIRKKLSDFNVIQTTSPLDGKSIWVEIFPASISKGHTADWLAGKLGVNPRDVLSLGNDYNDVDLLEWAGTSYVVENAPDELKERFSTVSSNNRCGVAEAVKRWLEIKAF
jgi:Cof subfamily protein (haloacid dehalogenase superfamily)